MPVQSNTEQAASGLRSPTSGDVATVEENCAAIENIFDQHTREIRRLRQRIARLTADLEECREYIEQDSDVNDGDYGEQVPNKAMRLCNMIDETLHGPGGY